MFKKYVIPAAIFILFTSPGAAASWLSLIERFTGRATFDLTSAIGVYQLAFPILGLLLLLFWIWWVQPRGKALPATQIVPERRPLSLDETRARIFVLAEQFDVTGLGTGPGDRGARTLTIQVISSLEDDLELTNVFGRLRINTVTTNLEFINAYSKLRRYGVTGMQANAKFTDDELRRIETFRHASPTTEIDLAFRTPRFAEDIQIGTINPGKLKIP